MLLIKLMLKHKRNAGDSDLRIANLFLNLCNMLLLEVIIVNLHANFSRVLLHRMLSVFYFIRSKLSVIQ